MSTHPKKLIEVALPLDEINAACKADKDRKTGTIRNLHKWFAPMPLPAWRALIFAALVDDPEDDDVRAELLGLIKRMVMAGADRPDDDVMQEAHQVLQNSFPNGLPTVLDPFCGGGSTLIEGQRLGLPVVGSDLNPVPALISRTLAQVLPGIAGGAPVFEFESAGGSGASTLFHVKTDHGRGHTYAGFAKDVEDSGAWIRSRAWEVLEPFYRADLPDEVIAWLWARTAVCPNPTCGAETVLATSWWISQRKGDLAWIEPKLDSGRIVLNVVSSRTGAPSCAAPKLGRGAIFSCVACGATLNEEYLSQLGMAGELGLRMTAVVAEQDGKRVYRNPTEAEVHLAASASPVDDFPDIRLPLNPRWFSGPRFGFGNQASLYTPRQLLTIATFADLVPSVHAEVSRRGGSGEWATAVTTLLGLCVGKMAQFSSTLAIWRTQPMAKAEAALASHSLPMMWDFPEVNVFGSSVGDWRGIIRTALRALPLLPTAPVIGRVALGDARRARLDSPGLVATDPPYFDQIGYADVSDVFYVWHRRALRKVQPDLYATVAAPKQGELTAVPSHHGNDKAAARDYFIDGFTETFNNLKASSAAGLPILIVYASKEQKGGNGEETRWSSILTAMIAADLEITGTWPIRGTTEARMISAGTNSVASYVVMVCRPRPSTAGTVSLSDFNRALRRELKPAVHALQAAGILPVDLAQAAMGPGMQVYSRYKAVLDQGGIRVPVDLALRLINQAIGEVLDEQEGELDPDSRFAVTWWEKHHWAAATFGEADQLARPKGISVDDVVRAGVAVYPNPGFVQLVGGEALDRAWTPSGDARPTAWEAVHHLADRLIDGGGAKEAGRLMSQLGILREQAQGLVYRLHAIAARKGWTGDQERYNALIGSWSDLLAEAGRSHDAGDGLF